jgi:hypothetical protein
MEFGPLSYIRHSGGDDVTTKRGAYASAIEVAVRFYKVKLVSIFGALREQPLWIYNAIRQE